jgi:hypothetical protein
VSPKSNNLNFVAAEETTLKTTVVAMSGERRRRQLLQYERCGKAVEGMFFFSTRLPTPNSALPNTISEH